MGQVTIYLDDDTQQKLDRAAKASGLSRSKWIREIILEYTTQKWPENIRKAAGSWEDFPDIESLRESLGKDAPREEL